MTVADHNRAVALFADTLAKIDLCVAALPCESQAQRQRVIELLTEIIAETRTLALTLKTGEVEA